MKRSHPVLMRWFFRLRRAPKLIDQLPSWGHQGPLVAFKYEDAATVITSASKLRNRVDAQLVVANSLCGGAIAGRSRWRYRLCQSSTANDCPRRTGGRPLRQRDCVRKGLPKEVQAPVRL